MARKHPLTEGKKNIIAALLQEYDIQSVGDIQEVLKNLLGGTIQSMMEAEMDNHLGYKPYERSENSNARNGLQAEISPKQVRGNGGQCSIYYREHYIVSKACKQYKLASPNTIIEKLICNTSIEN